MMAEARKSGSNHRLSTLKSDMLQPRTKLVETNQKRVLISSLPGLLHNHRGLTVHQTCFSVAKQH